MFDKSVILPQMSTAFLPDAPALGAGNMTGMELKGILARVEGRLKDLEVSADAASRNAGRPDAIRNLRRAVREGKRKGISTDTVTRLAHVLNASPSWLLTGAPDSLESNDVAAALLPGTPESPTVRVVGYVGAGSVAHYYALADEDFEEVPAPEGASDQTVAVEIRGKSLGPLMNSWLVFYDDVRSPITPDLFNQLCVVGLADDRVLVKEVRPTRSGGFDLHSNSSDEPPIRDADIEWAAKVTSMRPR